MPRFALPLLLLFGIGGCAPAPAPPPAPSNGAAASAPDLGAGGAEQPTAVAGSRGTIGVSLLTFKNPFFKVIADNITSEGAKHGYSVIALSADDDAGKQSNQVKDFIVQQVSAIVISPVESKSIVPVIQEANALGIPVFTVDIPCLEPGVKIVSQIATDNFAGGEEAGQAMIEALGASQGGDIAVIGYEQAESCRLRVSGFEKTIKAHNATGQGQITIVANLDGGGSKEQGLKVSDDLLQSHPNVRGIFAINDPSALGAVAALEKANRLSSVMIIGFDGQPEGKAAIRDGKIYADPIQFPDKMGVKVVESIVAHSQGEDVELQQFIPTSIYRKADAEKELGPAK